MSAVDWLLQNIGRATWWRGLACQQCGSGCCLEGGVDVPLPGGTPIYSLGTGTLKGAGYFCHGGPWFNTDPSCANGNPGYGVVTIDVPGVGQVYYQHIDLAPGIPFCESGNCSSASIAAGTLLGYSRANPGEVEVGINPTWGGIWGTNTDPNLWVNDPRGPLFALASGNSTLQPLSTITTTTPGVTNPFQPIIDFFKSDWLKNPKRLLKLIMGVSGLMLSLLVIFWPEAKQTIIAGAKAAALA